MRSSIPSTSRYNLAIKARYRLGNTDTKSDGKKPKAAMSIGEKDFGIYQPESPAMVDSTLFADVVAIPFMSAEAELNPRA